MFIIFAVFTCVVSVLFLKYIKIEFHPLFLFDSSTIWKVIVRAILFIFFKILINFVMFAFSEEFIWRFHCYDLIYGIFDLHEIRQQHVDLKLP